MSYLLDTNIISEVVKKVPHQPVLNWIDSIDSEKLYISVITLGEIRKGIAGIQDKTRQAKISDWLEVELPAYFETRVLTIDTNVADTWGRIQSLKKGKTLPAIDGLIAATACAHQLTIVTRNTKDFLHAPVDVFNPWDIV